MKQHRLLALLTLPLVIVGCSNNKSKPKPEPNTEEKGKVTITFAGNFEEAKSVYEVQFKYGNDQFRHSATIFDDDLKMLSLASSGISDSVDRATSFFETMFFDSFEDHGYEEITEDSVGYFFAHKTIDDFDLFAVSVRGFNYGKEWANNLTIGSEGNHQGFQLRANEISTSLSNYISTLLEELNREENSTVKVWISGYSRAGAIAGLVSDNIMTSNQYNIDENKLYTYTFEAPANVSIENKIEYENVFNLVNEADLVTYIPPEQYGLCRCGTDINIYNDQLEKWLKKLDYHINLPKFYASSADGYTNEKEFIEYLIGLITAETSASSASMKTRADYVNNYQSNIAWMISFFMSIPSSTTEKIMSVFQDLKSEDIIALMLGGDPIAPKIETILDEDEIEYDKTKLEESTGKLCSFMRAHGDLLAALIDFAAQKANEKMMSNISRVTSVHYPESTYVLLLNQNFAE